MLERLAPKQGPSARHQITSGQLAYPQT